MSEEDVPPIFENSHALEEIKDRNMSKVCSPAIYENSHALEEILEPPEVSSSEERPVKKSWTKENEATVKKWQTDIEKTSFIYNEVLLVKTYRMNVILVLTLLFSVLSTLFSALIVTLSFLEIKWVTISFEILILLLSAGGATLLGILQIFGFERQIEELARYTEKLDNAWFLFEIEMDIDPAQRSDAKEFIRRMDGQYLSLMQHVPSINPKEYTKATRKYQERLFDNYRWSLQFKKQMNDEIEII